MASGSFSFKRTGSNPPEQVLTKAKMSRHFFFSNLLISRDQVKGYLVSIPKGLVDVIAAKFLLDTSAMDQAEAIEELLENVYV